MNRMENINPLYHNPYGVTFQWKRGSVNDILKVQLVFRDTGLLLSHDELSEFSNCITSTITNTNLCGNCSKDEECRALLLETPVTQLSFAVSLKELKALKELVEGTLFQLGLNNLLQKL